MLQAYNDFWKRAFDFQGRSSRSDYWWALLVNLILSFLVVIIFVMLPLYSEMRSGQYDSQSLVALETTNNLPILLFSLVLLLPQLSLQARRLRDAGLHPGWAVLFLMPWIPVINIFSLFGNMALLIMSALPSKDN